MITQQVRCDICGKELSINEVDSNKSFLNVQINTKPTSKFQMALMENNNKKRGDLCLSCFRKVRDFIDDLKVKK